MKKLIEIVLLAILVGGIIFIASNSGRIADVLEDADVVIVEEVEIIQ